MGLPKDILLSRQVKELAELVHEKSDFEKILLRNSISMDSGEIQWRKRQLDSYARRIKKLTLSIKKRGR